MRHRVIARTIVVALLCAGIVSRQPTHSHAAGPVVSTVKVGRYPAAVVLDMHIGRVFVANEYANTVSLLSARSGIVLATVPVGNSPTVLADDPQTDHIFVASYDGNSVSLLDARSGRLLHTSIVGRGPTAMAVDEHHGRVFVVNSADSTISLLNGNKGLVERTSKICAVSLGREALAIEEQTGHAFVACTQSVMMLDAETGNVLASVPVSGYPTALAIDEQTRHVFVVSKEVSGYNSVGAMTMLDAQTGQRLHTTTVPINPSSLAIDAQSEHVFVATLGPMDDQGQYAPGSVSVLSSEKGTLLSTTHVGKYPLALAVDAQSRRVFVANRNSYNVSILDAVAGTSLGTVPVGQTAKGPGPSAIAIDGQNGRAFVANASDNSVSILDTRVAATELAAGPAHIVPLFVQWIRVSPQQPDTLYMGGTQDCADGCPSWMLRSLDSGTTWTNLTPQLSRPLPPPFSGTVTLWPPLFDPMGPSLYVQRFIGGSLHNSGGDILRSSDEGQHWQAISLPEHDGGGYFDLTICPLVPSRLFAILQYGSLDIQNATIRLQHSDDAGQTWMNGSDPRVLMGAQSTSFVVGSVVADPVHVNTVYVTLLPLSKSSSTPPPVAVARSDDAGLHWTQVATPTTTPPLKTFSVSTDPHLGAVLVGQTFDKEVPADRRYLSPDEGHTWSITTCPGDLHGV